MADKSQKVKSTDLLRASALNKCLLDRGRDVSGAYIAPILHHQPHQIRAKFIKILQAHHRKQGDISTADFDEIFKSDRDLYFYADNVFTFPITEKQLRKAICIPVSKCPDLATLGYIIEHKGVHLAKVRKSNGEIRIFWVKSDFDPISIRSQNLGESVTFIQINYVYRWVDISKRGKPGNYVFEGRWQHWSEIQNQTGWSKSKIHRDLRNIFL